MMCPADKASPDSAYRCRDGPAGHVRLKARNLLNPFSLGHMVSSCVLESHVVGSVPYLVSWTSGTGLRHFSQLLVLLRKQMPFFLVLSPTLSIFEEDWPK